MVDQINAEKSKKSFWARMMESLDKKMEEKAKGSSCCCGPAPKKDDKKCC